MSSHSFIVAQLGARMHYAVPLALHREDMLCHFFTDLLASKGWPRLLSLLPSSLLPSPARRLAARLPSGIPADRITAFTAFGCGYAARLARCRSRQDITETCLWAGRKFCELVLSAGLSGASGVYTFNSAGLELLQKARREGRRAVLEQTIAPKRLEDGLLGFERQKFPDWETHPEDDSYILELEYAEREEAEWREADCILCGSEFVRDGVAQCGGPAEKCRVVPYGVNLCVQSPALSSRPSSSNPRRPLHVLSVGAVGLRKGAPYAMEAAQRLKGLAEFRMVGKIEVSPQAQALLRERLELTGAVPRSEIAEHFQWADVLLLPSVCEGSATVTYEALGYGLPVICTPNAGSVVRDGTEGFIVPVRDVTAIAGRIELLARDVELRAQIAANAKARAAEYTVAAYGQRLLAALTGATTVQKSISA